MTENEAKGWLEYIGNMNLPYDRSPKSRKLACDMAIQALEKVQKFEAIGTVEEFKALKEKNVARKPIGVSMAKDKDKVVGNVGRCPCCNYIVAEDMLWCDECG